MIVYRLAKSKFQNDLSGKGAELAGGRWNSAGIPVLYTAESRALCALEIAVHTPLNAVPIDYVMISIELPDTVEIKEWYEKNMPPGWQSFPGIGHTRALGDAFFTTGKYLALKVPSAIVKGDHNILINPRHENFRMIKIVSSEPFEFDQRLFLKSAQA